MRVILVGFHNAPHHVEPVKPVLAILGVASLDPFFSGNGLGQRLYPGVWTIFNDSMVDQFPSRTTVQPQVCVPQFRVAQAMARREDFAWFYECSYHFVLEVRGTEQGSIYCRGEVHEMTGLEVGESNILGSVP